MGGKAGTANRSNDCGWLLFSSQSAILGKDICPTSPERRENKRVWGGKKTKTGKNFIKVSDWKEWVSLPAATSPEAWSSKALSNSK